MIHTPKFKSHLRMELLEPDAVVLYNETQQQALQGEFIYLLASLIDGKSSTSRIRQLLKGRAKESDVDAGLLFLEVEGLIAEAHETLSPGFEAFCDLFQIDARVARRRLKKYSVSVTSLGDHNPYLLISILRNLGIRAGKRGEFAVMLVDDYLCDGLEAFHRRAMQHGRPWMIAKPAGNAFWIGPVFHAQHTACWRCLAMRLKENRRAERWIEAHKKAKLLPYSPPTLPTTFEAALNLLANEILKHIVGVPAEHTLTTCDVREMKMERHAVMRLDHCPDCGSPTQKTIPAVLKSRKKIFALESGHRPVAADVTFTKYEHHISPITGIVDGVIPYESNGMDFAYSYVAGHIFLPRLQKEDVFRRGFVQQSGGKGMTAQQARTSALCEALERYSGVFRGNEVRKTATAKELANAAVLPNACMNFSQRQYSIRDEWNRTHHNHDWVPVPFDEQRKIEWTPVWSLTHRKPKYVPTAYCYYGYPLPSDFQFCRADSNGNAAGNSMEEAIVHAFLEIVERDATALWWFNKLLRPGVDLESFALPYIEALVHYYRKVHRKFWVLDLTADYPIPTFVAISNRTSGGRQFLVGFGAHFNPSVALIRAITEMNQFLPSITAGSTNGVLQPAARDVKFLSPDPKLRLKKLDDYPEYASDDFLKDINTCVKLAAQCGMETLVLDQTRSDVGISVAKVIVPGMRQFWPRFGRGRLYDIPVQLGWRKKPTQETELNQDRIVI